MWPEKWRDCILVTNISGWRARNTKATIILIVEHRHSRFTSRTLRNLMNRPSSVHLHLSYLYVNVHSGLCWTASIWGLNVQQRWTHTLFFTCISGLNTATLLWGFFFNRMWFYTQLRLSSFFCMSVSSIMICMGVIMRRGLMSSFRVQERFLF